MHSFVTGRMEKRKLPILTYWVFYEISCERLPTINNAAFDTELYIQLSPPLPGSETEALRRAITVVAR